MTAQRAVARIVSTLAVVPFLVATACAEAIVGPVDPTTDPAFVLSIASGNSQTATTLAPLGAPLVVRLLDRGNPVANQSITWTTLAAGGAKLASVTSLTNASGDASNTLILGSLVGPMTVTATVTGRTEAVTFSAVAGVLFTSVHAGNFFTCGLSVAGNAYCWGFNQNKQLGSTETEDFTNAPKLAVAAGAQFPVFRKIAGSVNHACGITIADQLMCWGVGTGNFEATTPTVVTIANASRILDVAVGGGHSCALEQGGSLICQGDNQRGQLGIAMLDVQGDPLVAVDSGATRFSSAAAGGVHSCGVVQGTQSVRCWGDNFYGQVGDGTNTTRGFSVAVAGTYNPASLVAGDNHTCALNNAGAAFCWGANSSGQIGDGTTTARNVPTAVSGGLVFASLYAGENHTCGVTAGGAAHCWGWNNAGQLGDGTRTNRSAPVAVIGGLTFTSLGLGSLHSCGVASTAGGASTIATGGTVYCWGDSEYGQAGTGVFSSNNTPFLTPTRVANQP